MMAPTWSLGEQSRGSGVLTHNLLDGDRLGQGGRPAAPGDVDPNDAEGDPGSRGEVLDSETTALHQLRVSRDPLVSYERGARLGTFLQDLPRCPSVCVLSAPGAPPQ